MYWFKRFKKEVEAMDNNIEVVPYEYGFARVMYKTPAKILYHP